MKTTNIANIIGDRHQPVILQGKRIRNGIACETVKRGQSYFGRIAPYENGIRLYSIECEIARLSRGDALFDAQKAAHDLSVENCLNAEVASP